MGASLHFAMKPLKIVLIVLGALVGLSVLLVVIGLIPAVQSWAVRKAVADQPGLEITFGDLAAGFSTATLGDVRVTQDGATIRVKSVDMQYSAWDYVTSGKVNVSRLAVAGVEIDLRQATGEATTAPRVAPGQPGAKVSAGSTNVTIATATAPFEGLLKAAQLPVDLVLAQLSAQGKTLLPEGREVSFDLKGSDLATGRTGTVKWTTIYHDPVAESAVQSVHNEGTMTIRLATDRKVERVEIDAMTSVVGPKLPSDRIHAVVTAEAAGGRETYAAALSLLRGTSATVNEETLLSSQAAFDPATKSIEGSWELATRTEQLGAILAGLGLPDLDLNGKGEFSFWPANSAASLKGVLQAKMARLEAISPELAVMGAVQVKTSFEGAMKGDVVSLTGLSLEAMDAANQKFTEVLLLQPLGFSLADQRVDVADAKAALASVALQEVPLAWGQPWLTDQRIESGTLSMRFTVAAEADGKVIRVQAAEPWQLKNVTVAQGEQKLVERLELRVNPKINYTAERVMAELADLSISLPAGDAAKGNVTVDVANLLTQPVITFTTKIDARMVTALTPFLPLDPGPLTIGADVQGNLQENTMLELTRAAVRVERTGDATLVTAIEFLQPLRVNLDSMEMGTDRPAEPTVRVNLGSLPLAWAEAFVADSKLSGSVTGGGLEVSVKALDDLSINTVEVVTLREVSATLAGVPQVQDLDLAMDVSAQLKGDAVTYDLRRLGLTMSGGGELAQVSAKGSLGIGENFSMVAKGKLDADVAALAQQPALASLVVAESGRLTGTFDATLRDTVVDAKVNVALRHFVTKGDNVKLADVDFALTATVDANGQGKVELPLTVGAGTNRSDVLLKGVFTLPPTPAKGAADTVAAAAISFEGAITSARLTVDDLQAFSALIPDSTAPEQSGAAAPQRSIGDRLSAAAGAAMQVTAGAPSPARDDEPFWQGLAGQLTLDLKEVHYGPETVISNVKGTARISPTGVEVDGLEALMKKEPLKVNGGITFDPKATKPYSLNGKVDVKGVAVGPLLQPANLQQRPQLEGIVAVDADVKGEGGTLTELLKNTYGIFDVNGTSGVLRMLGKRGDAIGKVSSFIGMVGALSGSESTLAASELASAFSELKFDQFKIRVERGADLSLKFSTIEFISPTLRLSGTGNIAAREGTELANQPMNIVLTMGGKGTMAQLLGKAGLLGGETDAQGYSMIKQKFTVGGTPTNADSNALWRLVTEAGLRAAAGFR